MYYSLNIHISDKYRTMYKNLSALGNENNKNITTKENYNQSYHDSLLPPIILHALQIFWKNKGNMSNHD